MTQASRIGTSAASRRQPLRAWQRPEAVLALAGTLALVLVVQLEQPLLVAVEVMALAGLVHQWSQKPPAGLRLAVLGSSTTTEALASDLASSAGQPKVVGRITVLAPTVPDRYWLGTLDQLSTLVDRYDIDLLLLCDGFPRMRAFDELDRYFPHLPVRLCELSSFYEDQFQHVPTAEINSAWFQWVLHPRHKIETPRSKRIVDVFIAVVVGIVAAPLLFALALLIRHDGGPALYRQVRVGERGRLFTILKLRTMRAEPGADTAWTRPDDDRVTPLGAFLRRTHVDELPQLLNVLRGEMSIVGPRPEQPAYVETLERTIPYYSRRHQLRPGITGWAQVNCGYGGSELGTTWKLSHDLYYLKKRSLSLDMGIIVRTVTTPFRQSQFAEPEVRPLILGLDCEELEESLKAAMSPPIESAIRPPIESAPATSG